MEPKKILVLGLHKAGKTSIVLSLKGKVNLLSFCNLNPTKGYDIENIEAFNSNYNIWDFGGQEQYRDDFISNFKKFIKGCYRVIFVIDIQEKEKYENALEYLGKIVNLIVNHDNSIEVSIFLHKYDPDLREIRPDITNDLINNLINQIKDKIPENLFYKVFKTTIYTLFEKIIID